MAMRLDNSSVPNLLPRRSRMVSGCFIAAIYIVHVRTPRYGHCETEATDKYNSVGIGMGTSLMIYSTRVNFAPAYRKYGKAIPEERLPPMIVGAIILPIAFFWFGWTSSPSMTWVPQVISSAFIGMGMLVTFWQGMVIFPMHSVLKGRYTDDNPRTT